MASGCARYEIDNMPASRILHGPVKHLRLRPQTRIRAYLRGDEIERGLPSLIRNCGISGVEESISRAPPHCTPPAGARLGLAGWPRSEAVRRNDVTVGCIRFLKLPPTPHPPAIVFPVYGIYRALVASLKFSRRSFLTLLIFFSRAIQPI